MHRDSITKNHSIIKRSFIKTVSFNITIHLQFFYQPGHSEVYSRVTSRDSGHLYSMDSQRYQTVHWRQWRKCCHHCHQYGWGETFNSTMLELSLFLNLSCQMEVSFTQLTTYCIVRSWHSLELLLVAQAGRWYNCQTCRNTIIHQCQSQVVAVKLSSLIYLNLNHVVELFWVLEADDCEFCKNFVVFLLYSFNIIR